MEAKETFSEKQALQLIEQTIVNTRQKFKDDGFSLIMWGWIVIMGNIVNYVALTQELHYLFFYWAIVCPIGGIVSGVIGARKERDAKVSSFSGEVMKFVWIGCGILAVILWFAAANFGWHYINPAMFVAFAAPVFITGGIMKFKPAMIGGLVLFAFGIGTFFVADQYWVHLVAAAGWALGYLIPGYMLQKDHRKNNV